MPLEALTKLGVYRLSARIHDLRYDGHKIQTVWKRVETAHGDSSRVAEYRLEDKDVSNGV